MSSQPENQPRRSPGNRRAPFRSRTEEWDQIGLRDQVERERHPKWRTALAIGALVAGGVAVLVVFANRSELFPGQEGAVRLLSVVLLAFFGWELAAVVARALTPSLLKRVNPRASGAFGFVIRLGLLLVVVGVALRVAGVRAETLAAGGAATVIVLGIAAQGTLSNVFAGVTMLGTRPFRVGERVKLQAGALAGTLEGVVAEQGLFYTTLRDGADRIQIPNSVMSGAAIIPLQEPVAVDVLAAFSTDHSPFDVESRLLERVDVPLRYPPHCALEEIRGGELLIRIKATPTHSDHGSKLASEVLEVVRAMNGETR